MGLIRKTLSISTLGLVNWRSKKERLRETTELLDLTQADLRQATEKHALIRDRLTEAERRAERAELASLRDSRRARWKGRRDVTSRVGLGRVALATLRGAVTPVVESAHDARQRVREDVEPAVDNAVSRTRKRSARALAKAERRAARLPEQGRRAARKARRRSEALVDRAADSAEQAADDIRVKARELTS